MLVKIGDHRINLSAVACVTEKRDQHGPTSVLVGFVSGDSLELIHGDAVGFLKTWDKWAEFQNAAQAVNEWAIAQNLEQIKAAQNKSGIIAPKMMIPRGRG